MKRLRLFWIWHTDLGRRSAVPFWPAENCTTIFIKFKFYTNYTNSPRQRTEKAPENGARWCVTRICLLSALDISVVSREPTSNGALCTRARASTPWLAYTLNMHTAQPTSTTNQSIQWLNSHFLLQVSQWEKKWPDISKMTKNEKLGRFSPYIVPTFADSEFTPSFLYMLFTSSYNYFCCNKFLLQIVYYMYDI